MTNPDSQARPDASLPAATGNKAGRKPRRGPRRATAPAGAPAKAAAVAPALLVVGTDGQLVPTEAPDPADSPVTHDAGQSPAAAPEPGAGAQPRDETPAEPASTQEDAGDGGRASAAGEEQVPLSRRERRLAEQNGTADVEVGAGAPDVKNGVRATPSVEPPQPQTNAGNKAPRRKRSRFTAFIRGLFFMLVISAVVVAMGTVFSGTKEASVGPSQTEQHRAAARERTTALLSQATALHNSTSSPAVKEILGRAVKDLAIQAESLGDGLPPSTSPATAAPTPAATVAGFMAALGASGNELLKNALTADKAMGRVFAAVGTNQVLRAQALGTTVGSTPPAPALPPTRVDFPAPGGPTCTSTLEPRPGVTIDSALRAAAIGEQKAIYAYQVAATRLAEPQFSKSAALLARHQGKLEVLNGELLVRCLPVAKPVAGFALDASFTATPGKALAGLERDLAAIYADLAALSPAAPVEETASPSTTGGKAPAATSLLREISVTWLLDSTQAQEHWGGPAGALAGMPAG
ncbi:DUF4439 domain-containing protein [Arthrobacter sp. LAPM80]|uniref:DUF4439 domain-containing protein n=1 Tax=Arthrobacter sp. LAPM80 TaxID=3141788 RepID=UPI00398B270F